MPSCLSIASAPLPSLDQQQCSPIEGKQVFASLETGQPPIYQIFDISTRNNRIYVISGGQVIGNWSVHAVLKELYWLL